MTYVDHQAARACQPAPRSLCAWPGSGDRGHSPGTGVPSAARAFVLVEGVSDQIAVEAHASRHGTASCGWMTARSRWNSRGSSSIRASEARVWAGAWPPSWPGWPDPGNRGCSCGSIPATSPPSAVTPRRALRRSSRIRRPLGTSASRSATYGSAWSPDASLALPSSPPGP